MKSLFSERVIYNVPVPGNAKPSTSQKHVPRGRIQRNVSRDKQDNAGSSAGGPFHVSAQPFDSVESPPFPSKTSRARCECSRKLSGKGTSTAYHIRRRGNRDKLRVPPFHVTPYARHGCMRRKCMKHVHRISAASRRWFGYISPMPLTLRRWSAVTAIGRTAALMLQLPEGARVDATWLPCCCAAELQIEETMATGNGVWESGPLRPAGPWFGSTRGRGTFDLQNRPFCDSPVIRRGSRGAGETW